VSELAFKKIISLDEAYARSSEPDELKTMLVAMEKQAAVAAQQQRRT
jgi:hypothetical protein